MAEPGSDSESDIFENYDDKSTCQQNGDNPAGPGDVTDSRENDCDYVKQGAKNQCDSECVPETGAATESETTSNPVHTSSDRTTGTASRPIDTQSQSNVKTSNVDSVSACSDKQTMGKSGVSDLDVNNQSEVVVRPVQVNCNGVVNGEEEKSLLANASRERINPEISVKEKVTSPTNSLDYPHSEGGLSTESEEEELDPRVKEQLDTLNSCSDEINKLELELEHARKKFRCLLNDSSQHLNVLYKKIGKVVHKARPYYDALKEARQAQADAQKAAMKFQRMNSVYKAAKETVSLAEERLSSLDEEERMKFDSAWQEMMNHATLKFMQSEEDKRASEAEHLQMASYYSAKQQRVRDLQRQMPRSIQKARQYFELKERLEVQLQQQKENVEDLQRALLITKQRYQGALHNLESISEEVHVRRQRQTMFSLRPHGGEMDDTQSDLPSINLDINSETGSIISEDQLDSLSGDFSICDEFDLTSACMGPRSHSNPESPDCSLPSAITAHRLVRKSSENNMGDFQGDRLETPSLSQRLRETLTIKAASRTVKEARVLNGAMGGPGVNGDTPPQLAGVEQTLPQKDGDKTVVETAPPSDESKSCDSAASDGIKVVVPQGLSKPANQRVLEVKTAPPAALPNSPQGSPKGSPKHGGSGAAEQRPHGERRQSPRSPRRSTSGAHNGEIMLNPSSLQSHQNYFPTPGYRPFGPRISPARSQLKPAESDPLNALGNRLK